ncbi:MAG: hypothetical protein LBB74_07060 [Chitinispirillales bacterium]|nr:hypothetical protein [Chitinispirillales bacterium]
MRKTILYIATAATMAAIGAAGCNDGWINAGRVSEEANAFLNKFDNKADSTPVTSAYRLVTNVSAQGGGTVSRVPDKAAYAFGEAVTVTATPASGYTFTSWSGASTSTNSSVTVTMDGNKALTASFAQTYTLATSVSPSGGVAVERGFVFDFCFDSYFSQTRRKAGRFF